jgi:hypothetical protein
MSSEKIEAFWQDATADDVAETMKTGKPIPARVRNEDGDSWLDDSFLQGWINGNWAARGAYWSHCQVYREPSWWTSRPDPGPGFRLLEKFPDEELKPGDEIWLRGKKWAQSHNAEIGEKLQQKDAWYRRRIEAVEPKFALGQTVKVVGPKQIPALEWSSVGMAQYAGTTQTIDRVELLTNPPGTYYHLKGVVNWCFREDYLEAVEPEPVEAPNTYHYTNPGDVVHCPNGTVIVIGSKGFEVTQ